MAEPVYKRVLLKVSGEALAGDQGHGLDFNMISQLCDALQDSLALGVQIGIVVGGGNFWRGAKNVQIERSRSDHIGMLATVMNCLAVADICEQKNIPVRVQTAIAIPTVADSYTYRSADENLKQGRVVIFGAGTGSPYFSTDTGAVLKAVELHADLILLAKNIDGVYSADPVKYPNATRYDKISYSETLEKRLGVMDLTATSLAMENHIPIRVFAVKDPENITRILKGESIGTLVSES